MVVIHAKEPKAIRVLCVDDNPLVIASLQRTFERSHGVTWVGDLRRADELTERVKTEAPEIVLLDIDMPGVDPFVALSRMSRECPETRTIMLSAYVSDDLIRRALDSGAWGYVSKQDPIEGMLESIKKVSDGEMYFSPKVQQVWGARRSGLPRAPKRHGSQN